MCFFPIQNNTKTQNKISQFNCGYCPECLSARSNHWALRSVMESKNHAKSCMVTLTYDTFVYDEKGNIVGENLNLRSVDKKDCQKFVKRLREYFDRVYNIQGIKIILSAEYGKRTHRPHYHAILFGVGFDDLRFHKKSKRGNSIYRSPTLDKLWKHGIATVDATLITPAVAKYCTKYAMKNYGVEDTFMLVSQKLGVEKLLEEFNGLSYILDGQEYPIPRIVWQKYISNKYNLNDWTTTYKYINKPKDYVKYKWTMYSLETEKNVTNPFYKDEPQKRIKNTIEKMVPWTFEKLKRRSFDLEEVSHVANKYARERFRFIRDKDEQYKAYLEYWKDKAEKQYPQIDTLTKINTLEDKRFHDYKDKARHALFTNIQAGKTVVVPRKEKHEYKARVAPFTLWEYRRYENVRSSFARTSRQLRANDRKDKRKQIEFVIFNNGEVVLDDFL